jgi:hypothetical protein
MALATDRQGPVRKQAFAVACNDDLIHCEFRTGLGPVPLDETSHPPFHIHSGRLSRDERLHYFSFSVRKLPLGCFGTSLLAMTIQLDRRPLVAGANGGGIKAPSKPFSKLLQNSRVLLQAFPNKSLAVLWDFNGLQVFQTPFDAFQIFRLRPPAFGRILPDFTMQFSRRRFHRGAATQIERILNLTDNPVFGKKYP